MSLKAEIFEQPTVLDRLLRTQMEPARDIARLIRDRGVHWVLIAARGTSDHAALYAGLDGPDCHLEETLFPRDMAQWPHTPI